MRARAASPPCSRPEWTQSWRPAMRTDLSVDARDVPTLPGDEHDQVRFELNPRAMAAYLQEAIVGATQGGHPVWHAGAGVGARVVAALRPCYILDVKYEPGEYCTILYRLGERMVVGTLRWP